MLKGVAVVLSYNSYIGDNLSIMFMLLCPNMALPSHRRIFFRSHMMTWWVSNFLEIPGNFFPYGCITNYRAAKSNLAVYNSPCSSLTNSESYK